MRRIIDEHSMRYSLAQTVGRSWEYLVRDDTENLVLNIRKMVNQHRIDVFSYRSPMKIVRMKLEDLQTCMSREDDSVLLSIFL